MASSDSGPTYLCRSEFCLASLLRLHSSECAEQGDGWCWPNEIANRRPAFINATLEHFRWVVLIVCELITFSPLRTRERERKRENQMAQKAVVVLTTSSSTPPPYEDKRVVCVTEGLGAFGGWFVCVCVFASKSPCPF